MDTSNFIKQPQNQEDFARRNELKEEESRSGNSCTDSINSGSGPDYQIYIPLG
jgi:hypothetical protein